MSRVIVIGAGIAGSAAALRARAAGAEVVLVDRGVGASLLGGGAWDDEVWERREEHARALGVMLDTPTLGEAERSTLEALGAVAPPSGTPATWIASTSGLVRSTIAHDPGLLDVRRMDPSRGPLRLLIPRAERAGWDADAIAASLRIELPAHGMSVEVEAIDASVLRFDDERRIADVDLAARHDEAARRAWLVERLRPFATPGAAFLLGPWLGASFSWSAEVSAALGAPVGEALAPLSGVTGGRFATARDASLALAGVARKPGWVESVTREGGAHHVTLAGGDRLTGSAVVLALGGLAGGGVLYDPPEHASGPDGAAAVHSPFKLSLALDGALVGVDGARRLVGSMFGPALEAGWPRGSTAGALERVGVTARDGVVVPGVWAAGDVVAGGPRTALRALREGMRAGEAAAAG